MIPRRGRIERARRGTGGGRLPAGAAPGSCAAGTDVLAQTTPLAGPQPRSGCALPALESAAGRGNGRGAGDAEELSYSNVSELPGFKVTGRMVATLVGVRMGVAAQDDEV